MENRLECLRYEINKLIGEKNPEESRYFAAHLYGVSSFCVLLALRRGLDAELAAACGILHDVYQVTAGEVKKHAKKGAKQARLLLEKTGMYTDDEMTIISSAIARHSKKRAVHGPYDEVLKDADVLDHCLYNPDFPANEKETARFDRILMELDCGARKAVTR